MSILSAKNSCTVEMKNVVIDDVIAINDIELATSQMSGRKSANVVLDGFRMLTLLSDINFDCIDSNVCKARNANNIDDADINASNSNENLT